ncbi:MAG: hypothetical protein AAGA12_00380 [Pseudomonadota bacterium]
MSAMNIPKLKRIKVSTEQELRTWLRKNAEPAQEVMIITGNKKSGEKHIPSQSVRDVVRENGWEFGRSYTLNGNLKGHVVRYGV